MSEIPQSGIEIGNNLINRAKEIANLLKSNSKEVYKLQEILKGIVEGCYHDRLFVCDVHSVLNKIAQRLISYDYVVFNVEKINNFEILEINIDGLDCFPSNEEKEKLSGKYNGDVYILDSTFAVEKI